MRRLLTSVATVCLLTVQQAQAQAPLSCLGPQERSVVEVAALRSELMVLAIGCHQDDRYNAFARKFQADLLGNERAVDDIFKRKYGRRAQLEHDHFTTELANGESSAGLKLGSDFCDRNGMLFTEVLALRSPSELPPYAAGKDLIPNTTEICTEVEAASSKPRGAPASPAKHH
jgi:hypothetical protein